MERPNFQPDQEEHDERLDDQSGMPPAEALARVIDLQERREARATAARETPKERLDRLVAQHDIPRNEDGSLSHDRWNVPNDVIMEITRAEEAYQESLIAKPSSDAAAS